MFTYLLYSTLLVVLKSFCESAHGNLPLDTGTCILFGPLFRSKCSPDMFAFIFYSTLFVVLTAFCKSADGYDFCKTEYSQGVGNNLFKWYADFGNGPFTSDPLCIDNNSRIVERSCYNGTWLPRHLPVCYTFNCSTLFIATYNLCRYVTKPLPYDSGCPDAGSIVTSTGLTTSPAWSQVKRKVKFGPLEYDRLGNLYGTPYPGNSPLDCMVLHKYNITEPMNCTELFPHVCDYTPKDFLTHLETNQKQKMEVILNFDTRERQMYLTVYSPENLKVTDPYGAIFCFTNAGSKLKETVILDLMYDTRHNPSFNSTSFRNYAVYVLDLEDEPGQYWCEAFHIGISKPITSNTIIGYEEKYGNEYSWRTIANYPCNKSCTIDEVFDSANDYCKQFGLKCRLMEVFRMDENEQELLLHVTTKYKHNVIGEYYKLASIFENVNLTFVYFKSSEVCLPETTTSGGKVYHWTQTPLGATARTKELCLNANGVIVTRKCVGDFLYGAEWSDLTDTCSDAVHVSDRTKFLYDIVANNVTVASFKNLTYVVDNPYDLTAVDVALVSDGMYEISMQNSTELKNDYTKTISNLIKSNRTILREAHMQLKSTDKILDAIDIFLNKDGITGVDSLMVIQEQNFIVHVTKPFLNNLTGLALYGNASKTFLDYTVINMSRNETFENLSTEDLELAIFIPEELLSSLAYSETAKNTTVITTVFYNDSLFNEDDANKSTRSKIVGVTIPGFGVYLKTPIPLLLRSSENSTQAACAYWDYEVNSNKKSHWSTTGSSYIENYGSSLASCAFSHLTHFALLIMSERIQVMEEAEGVTTNIDTLSTLDKQLTIITAVGCSLSFVGLLGIFVTAILFKRWRDKIGTKILLQLSVIIILEIVTTQLAGMDNWDDRPTVCTLIGILLQYIVLAQFSWMLVIAYLQYLRFVKVLGPKPEKLLLKSMLIGWLLPLVPVILTVAVFPSSYSGGHQNFCYPKGLALYIGLFTPAIITVLANVFIFVMIMCTITRSKVRRHVKSTSVQKLHVYIAILLFFMLGIHWLFGIMAEILSESWLELAFVYLFCLTATLQGFVLFIFYVVIDKETRLLWTIYMKSLV